MAGLLPALAVFGECARCGFGPELHFVNVGNRPIQPPARHLWFLDAYVERAGMAYAQSVLAFLRELDEAYPEPPAYLIESYQREPLSKLKIIVIWWLYPENFDKSEN